MPPSFSTCQSESTKYEVRIDTQEVGSDVRLLFCAYGPQAVEQRRRQRRLDVGRNNTDCVQILEMDTVVQTKARQLHLHQVGRRRDENTFARAGRRRESGNGLEVVGTHAFSDEYQVNGASRAWVARVDEHVDAGGVTVLEARRPSRFDDAVKIAAIDRNIEIPRRSRRERIALVDVQKYCDPSDDPVLNLRSRQRARQTCDDVEKLLHMPIVRGNRRHTVVMIITRDRSAF